MPRLRNAVSGVVVNVSDDKAARMPSDWVAVEDAQPAKKAPAKRSSSNK